CPICPPSSGPTARTTWLPSTSRRRQPEMSRGRSRGRRHGGGKEEESSERWLLTYADMITLLTAVFAHIKAQLDAYARAHGFAKSVQTSIEARGLVIKVLTDDLLFESGQATLEGRSHALLGEIGQLLNVDETHPIDVEGNTDSVPIHGGVYPSNWELSTARASTVVRFLAERGVSPHRLTATGYAEQHPLASNATAAGRARNRRVEIVMKRIYRSESEPRSEERRVG